jgi:hypothetical protein
MDFIKKSLAAKVSVSLLVVCVILSAANYFFSAKIDDYLQTTIGYSLAGVLFLIIFFVLAVLIIVFTAFRPVSKVLRKFLPTV